MDIKELLGKTLTECFQVGSAEIHFKTTDGKHYKMHHIENCCESVTIDDVCGELSDLVGSPVLQAEEVSSRDAIPGQVVSEYGDSFTWTFYRLATAKGNVSIRWYGTSNGYYSESVDFEEVTNASL